MAVHVVSPESAVVPFTSATLPAVADRFGAVPEASGVGRLAPTVVDAVVVWTRK